MDVVQAPFQTVEEIYGLIGAAVANKQPMEAAYQGRQRLFWPHRLGRNRGTMLRADATFDNSPNNRFNPDAKAEVRWGDQTWEEMMVGFFDVAIPSKTDLTKVLGKP
ncbi:MAG TPA: hypothetical protein VGL82_07620 [Bryobacteraceae bacterium]|jgi:hypothetical protein